MHEEARLMKFKCLRGCCRLAASGGMLLFTLLASRPAASYDIVNRWTATQVDGGNLQRGTPVTLRWSIVPDGQSYSRSSNSQVVKFLDDGWNVPAANRVPNLTNRPWWTVINNAYAQFGRVSGIDMVYVAEQHPNGADTGMEGDIRIGGEIIGDGPGGALADNTFPNQGDMRIDATKEANGTVGSYFSTEPGLRNLVIHETGHGVGLGHTEFVNNSAKAVMEGGLRTDIWGLQFDDVYALNRQYGDPKEKNGGNDLVTRATHIGDFATSGRATLGLDASDSTVGQFDDDWLGIDGSNDLDWFRFSISDWSVATIRVTPIGPQYHTVQQGPINAAALNDLVFQAFKSTPTISQIAMVDNGGLGVSELLSGKLLPTAGDYYVRVRGQQDVNQFYRLDVILSDLPGAGTTADINLDGMTNIGDWQIFSANAYTDISSFSRREQFVRGDLDLDGDNDLADFRLFKNLFDAANGVSAFARLVEGVPEPGALSMLAMIAVAASLHRRRQRCC
jgi:serralysin